MISQRPESVSSAKRPFALLADRDRQPSRMTAARPYLLILLSALAFASMTACGHALHGRCDWRVTTIARSGLVFLFALWIALRRRAALVFFAPRTLWMRSIVGSISMLFTFYAMDRLPVGTLLTLTNTFPLWVTLLAWPVLGDRPTIGFGLALVSGLIGVVLIERPQAGTIRPETIAALIASLATAVVMLGLHRLRFVDPLAIVVHFSGVATVIVTGFAILTSDGPIDLNSLRNPTTALLLAGVGLLATAGQIAMTMAFGSGSPQALSVVLLSQVLFAIGLDWLFWGRTLDLAAGLGTLMILAPVAWLVAQRPRT